MTRQSKIDALQRLAALDSGATPAEREVAKTKLAELLAKSQPNAELISQAYGRSPLADWAKAAERAMQDMVASAFMWGYAAQPFEEEKRPTDDPPIQD